LIGRDPLLVWPVSASDSSRPVDLAASPLAARASAA
jgi:hypothetical protein